MPRVTSSVIDWVGYDATSQTLKVLFMQGRRYTYLAIPETVYRELLDADPIGAFDNACIEDRYRYRRH